MGGGKAGAPAVAVFMAADVYDPVPSVPGSARALTETADRAAGLSATAGLRSV